MGQSRRNKKHFTKNQLDKPYTSTAQLESPPDFGAMNFYCYILISEKSGKYYTGSCKDKNVRLSQHNTGLVKSTAKEIPWRLIYSETFIDLKLARQRESQIKRWHSRKAIERLINKGAKIEDPRSGQKPDRDVSLIIWPNH